MKDSDIIAAARKRMADAIEADRRNREEALDDMECIAGRIWPEAERERREASGRPVITVNRLPQFVRQVTGDIRRINPAIKVIPGDERSSPEIAEILEGLTRQIEYNSGASAIYETATEQAAMCGMGAFRILAEYADDESFDQEIRIRHVPNPFAVYWDPTARMPTREDAGFVFITEQMSEKDFRDTWPDAALIDAEHDGDTDGLENWRDDASIVVAEYIWKEPVKRKIALSFDGTTLADPEQIKVAEALGVVIKSRTVDTHKVMWAKISGKDVLDGPTELPCRHIPVVAVMGEEVPVGDEVVRTSVIRWAKDPARLYCYYSSTMAEVLALQPKSPYMVTAKQIAGQEANWARASDENLPFLVYNPDEKAGGAPQRVPPPMVSQGVMAELARASDDMKATTGIYDAAVGAQSNETSGVAIRQRQMESDIATSVYSDNLAKSIEHCGRIILDMIPRIYDAPRMVRIMGQDEQEQIVGVNQPFADPMTGQSGVINAITRGKYDVRVAVGPNYTTRRQEAAESMMAFVQAVPMAGQVAADLIAKAMDWPDADKLADRLERILPPNVAGQEQNPAAMQQAMQAQAAAQEIEMRKAQAEAVEAEADARKAVAEAMKAEFDLRAAQVRPVVQPGTFPL